jgi:hypothetical protein
MLTYAKVYVRCFIIVFAASFGSQDFNVETLLVCDLVVPTFKRQCPYTVTC